MTNFKDWAKCAYYNKFTFGTILGVSTGVGFISYGLLEKNSSVLAAGFTLLPLSGLGLLMTNGGRDTLKAYYSTRKELHKKNRIPRCFIKENLYYCTRRGIELAVSDYEKENRMSKNQVVF
ncbi:MAG: hypothetical protein OEL87_01080 [Nanoarchaeota archaeon]|nr:hypothetical protein [Nanoarchaeota archaeon]